MANLNYMDKKNALSVLISNSDLLSDEQKKNLLEKINQFNDDQIEKLGVFFANEMKMRIEDDKNLSKQTAEILKNIL